MNKEEIIEILKKESYSDATNDLILYESEFEFVAERLVKLCNLQNVRQQSELLLQAYKEGFDAATASLIGANKVVQERKLQQ